MKEVRAYIKSHKLSAVTLALHQVDGLTGMSIIDAKGFGRRLAKDAGHHIVGDLVDYIPHVKIEIICRDDLVEKVVSTIQEAAHTGLHGDGKIYVFNIEQAFRISTGESGEKAV